MRSHCTLHRLFDEGRLHRSPSPHMPHSEKLDSPGSGMGSSDASDNDDKICRDYLRNVCHRGTKCRFRHPDGDEREALGGARPESMFCHDFQNKSCSRPSCKFIHCTREEQLHFSSTGELPMHILEIVIDRGLVSEVFHSRLSGPVCKDFLKGECKRGGKCKFRHMAFSELKELFAVKPSKRPERSDDAPCNGHHCYGGAGCNGRAVRSPRLEPEPPTPPNMRAYRSLDSGWLPPEPKRCHYDATVTQSYYLHPQPPGHGHQHQHQHQQQQHQAHLSPHHHALGHHHSPSFVTSFRSLEEENAFLTKKVERLEREVSDLKATNEFLLDQNAQLRYCNGRVTTVNSLNTVSVTGVAATGTPVASVSVPAIAQISQPGGHPATAATVVAAQGAIAPVTISMSQPLTTQGMPTTTIPISLSSAVNAIQGPVVSAGTTALVTYPAVMTQNIRTSGILSN